MKSYLTDFNEISTAQRDMDHAQALDDLNIERQGLSVGRTPRFLGDNDLHAIATGKRGKDADSALEFSLVAQQSYEALLSDTWDGLRGAEAATEHTLHRVQDDLAASTAALQTTLDRAATLPDGTRVFRDENGEVWNKHGEQVEPILAATIEWQGHEPSHDTFLTRSDAVAHDQDRLDAIRGHQVTLGGYRERLSDEDNPPTRDELDDIGSGIDRIMANIAPIETNDRELATQTHTAEISLPGLGD